MKCFDADEPLLQGWMDESDEETFETEVNDFGLEQDSYADLCDASDENMGPPELTKEKLMELDAEAEEYEKRRLLQDQGNGPVLKAMPYEFTPKTSERLNVKMVADWRFRANEKGENKCWRRRARLVTKELKVWDPHRTDLYSPATSPAVLRLLPHLFTLRKDAKWVIFSIDVKDAFLQVDQPTPLYIFLDGRWYQVSARPTESCSTLGRKDLR